MKKITSATIDVMAPARNDCLNLLVNEQIVIGRKAKTENGQPRITPAAATATAMAGFSKRNNADERDMAYIENELGKKPTKKKSKLRVDMSGQQIKRNL